MAAVRQVESDLAAQQESLRLAQAEAFSVAQQLTRVRNEITALDLQKQGNVVRLEKLSAEKIQLEEERSRLETRLQEFAAHVEAEKLSVQTSRGTVEERQQRLREIQEELNQVTKTMDEVLCQQAENRYRLHVLDQLQAEHEGFSAGTLAALKNAQHVLGSLADKIRVPDRYITAIEMALGHHLQLVLTEQPEAAQQILADLSAHKKGRASIAPLALLQSNGSEVSSVPSGEPAGAAGHGPEANGGNGQPARILALSIVEAEDSIQPLLRRLLGQTVIVPDLAAGTAAWREQNGAFDFVTFNGELLSRHGVYTGGSSNGSGKAPSSILGRKNQIADLQTALVRLQEQIGEASRRKGTMQSEQTALQAGLQQAQTDLRTQEVAIATRQGEFNALQNSLRTLHQKIDTVVYEIQSLAAQEQEGMQKRSSLAVQAGALESREADVQSRVKALNSGLENSRQQRDQANTALTETKVSLAGEEQLCASFRQQQQALEHRVQMAQLVAQRRRGKTPSSNAAGSAGGNRGSRRAIESAAAARAGQRAERVHGREGKPGDRDAAREEDVRGRRRGLAELQEQRGALEVELAKKNMSVRDLRQRVQEKYQLHLDDVRSECITITIASEGPAKVETLTPDEMAARGLATDWNAVADQVAALQKRIDEIGPVNLVAIEEYEETEQRYEFLTAQHDDLVKAKQQLLDVINRINLQTKEMFSETFAKIRENFRSLFAEIFGGGKADLLLVDEGDVLESGIDIVARPPGKQLQSISLLSGGEQTMTAVALLFSIYQVKPSPFCVLDELDAPLDESNISRFIRILQRFLVHSQFIIITHNKRTIGMADVLYGVTMEEQGISKIVSVKFHKVEEVATDHPIAPLVPLPPVPTIEEEEDKVQARQETLELAMAD